MAEKEKQQRVFRRAQQQQQKAQPLQPQPVAAAMAGEEQQQCAHEIIMKDLCAKCGKDLRVKGGFSGERTEPTAANVSMIHHVPELVVSNQIANELGARDQENILQQRKLILLIDLDQTLVHTSNRAPKPEEAGAMDLFCYRLGANRFCTKIRPHTRAFLQRMHKLYEMHIVTYGQRIYAHKIAELLDPSRVLFEYRVLSRDELLSSFHKCGNLKALFPCSERLVVMLDDRPDVWMHSEALIRIKPYRFFTEVGDINAPPAAIAQNQQQKRKEEEEEKRPMEEEEEKGAEAEILSTSLEKEEEEERVKEEEEEKVKVEAEKMEEEEKVVANENEGKTEEEEDGKRGAAEGEGKARKATSAPDFLSQPIAPLPDDDRSLEHTGRVLAEVHSLFYRHYDRDKKLPDVKRIVGWLRTKVLAGERIVFSGIVPLGVDIRSSELYRLCVQFGAKVVDNVLREDDWRTATVLVAARAATEKYRCAKRLRIPVVSVRWLYTCFERWQKVDKRDFLFREEEEKEEGQQKDVGKGGGGLAEGNQQKGNGEGGERGKKRMSTEEGEAEQGEMVGEEADGQGPLPVAKRGRLMSSDSLCLNDKMDHFSQMDTIDKRALHDMEDEVENALSEGDEEGSDGSGGGEGGGEESLSSSQQEEAEGEEEGPSTSGGRAEGRGGASRQPWSA